MRMAGLLSRLVKVAVSSATDVRRLGCPLRNLAQNRPLFTLVSISVIYRHTSLSFPFCCSSPWVSFLSLPRARATYCPSHLPLCVTRTTWGTYLSGRPDNGATSSSSTRGRFSCTRTLGQARTRPSTGSSTYRWERVRHSVLACARARHFLRMNKLMCCLAVLCAVCPTDLRHVKRMAEGGSKYMGALDGEGIHLLSKSRWNCRPGPNARARYRVFLSMK